MSRSAQSTCIRFWFWIRCGKNRRKCMFEMETIIVIHSETRVIRTSLAVPFNFPHRRINVSCWSFSQKYENKGTYNYSICCICWFIHVTTFQTSRTFQRGIQNQQQLGHGLYESVYWCKCLLYHVYWKWFQEESFIIQKVTLL